MATPRARGPVLTLVIAVAVATATTDAAATDAVARRPLLPTVRCPLETALEGITTPKVARRERAAVPATLARRLAIYLGGPERVVAPRGWRCRAIAAVNGGSLLVVEPRAKDPKDGVRSWRERACVGCIYDAACTLFPQEAAPLSVGVGCGRRPAGRRVTRIAPMLARYRDTDGETGLVLLDAGVPEAAGVVCRAPGAGVCAAVLAAWRA